MLARVMVALGIALVAMVADRYFVAHQCEGEGHFMAGGHFFFCHSVMEYKK
jgi:hypothetical protein